METTKKITDTQERLNLRSILTHSTGVRGVTRRGNRYNANIIVNGKHIYLGSFLKLSNAKDAYDKAVIKYNVTPTNDQRGCSVKKFNIPDVENITKQTVIDHILTDPFYEEVLKKYLSNKNERDEFRQELWLILLEMPEEKLIHYYDTKCLKYIYIGIINNQIKSNTSAWHRNFRKNQPQEYFDNIYDSIDEADHILHIKTETEDKLDYITGKLEQIEQQDPKMVRDITLFKMHFYEGMTYRAIEQATNIGYVNVFHYVNNIKNILIKNKSQVKITDPTLC